MNQVNAARAAGYSEEYAKQACRIEKLVKVSLADEFERAGLTDKTIVAHALAGLNALKLQSCNIYISKPNAESIDNDKLIINKNSNDFVEVEDWNARHKYFNSICEMTERIRHRIEHSGEIKGGTTINVYPSKVLIFKDIKEDASITRTDNLYAEESAIGNRSEVKI